MARNEAELTSSNGNIEDGDRHPSERYGNFRELDEAIARGVDGVVKAECTPLPLVQLEVGPLALRYAS